MALSLVLNEQFNNMNHVRIPTVQELLQCTLGVKCQILIPAHCWIITGQGTQIAAFRPLLTDEDSYITILEHGHQNHVTCNIWKSIMLKAHWNIALLMRVGSPWWQNGLDIGLPVHGSIFCQYSFLHLKERVTFLIVQPKTYLELNSSGLVQAFFLNISKP